MEIVARFDFNFGRNVSNLVVQFVSSTLQCPVLLLCQESACYYDCSVRSWQCWVVPLLPSPGDWWKVPSS